MLAACLASSAGLWNVGRTATINSSCRVTAASAAAVDQASSEGACGPLMSFKLSSAISVRSKPISSLRRASLLTYSQLAAMFSSLTLRNQPPKTGSQYPYLIGPPPVPDTQPNARADRSRQHGVLRQQSSITH